MIRMATSDDIDSLVKLRIKLLNEVNSNIETMIGTNIQMY